MSTPSQSVGSPTGTGFVVNSRPSEFTTKSTLALRNTVGLPVAIVMIISRATNQQFIIANVTYIETYNSLLHEVPQGQVQFVLPPGTEPPPIGPMDQIYIYMSDQQGALAITTNLQFDENFIAMDNRVYTGVVIRMTRSWDRNIGKSFTIEFASNTYRFLVTSEYRPNQAVLNNNYNPGGLPAYLAAAQVFQGPIWPGLLVEDACYESGVFWRYIFNPADLPSSQVDYTNDQDAYLQFLAQNLAPGAAPNDGVRVDAKYNILTAVGLNTLYAFIPTDFNPITHTYDKWASLLAQLCETSFAELFCTRFGELYFRQVGMFLPANTWGISVQPETIVSFKDWEDSSNIVTELEIRVDSSNAGSVFGANQWLAPNWRELEYLYGRRYEKIEAPWAYFTSAQDVKLNPSLAQNPTMMQDYLNAYATIHMAMMNASNIAGHVQILGWPNFEVGSTIYLPHVDMVYYVQTVRHTFEVGKNWLTDLDLVYGRPPQANFWNYINQRAVSTGVLVQNSDGTYGLASSANGQSVGVTSSSAALEVEDSPVNDNFVPLPDGSKISPYLNNIQCGLQQDWDVKTPFNPKLHIHTGVDLKAPIGSVLVAVVDGILVGADVQNDSEGWGYFAIIQADPDKYPGQQPFSVVYAHMQAPTRLAIGQSVIKGMSIVGTEGETGNVIPIDNFHLHFQVQAAGENLNTYPTSDIKKTIDPFKVISINDPDPKYRPRNYTVSTSTDSTVVSQAGLIYKKPFWADPNYKTDIPIFGNQVAAAIGGTSLMYQALIAEETGWLQQMTQVWNVGSIGNFSSTSLDGVPQKLLPNGQQPANINDAATIFINLMNTDPYRPYRQALASPFGITVDQALTVLLNIYNHDNAAEEHRKVMDVYNNNLNKNPVEWPAF